MRTREIEAGELATLSLGQQLPSTSPQRNDTWADSITTLGSEMRAEKRPGWICGPGDLGKLQPHQGYVASADGTRTERPGWVCPVVRAIGREGFSGREPLVGRTVY